MINVTRHVPNNEGVLRQITIVFSSQMASSPLIGDTINIKLV